MVAVPTSLLHPTPPRGKGARGGREAVPRAGECSGAGGPLGAHRGADALQPGPTWAEQMDRPSQGTPGPSSPLVSPQGLRVAGGVTGTSVVHGVGGGGELQREVELGWGRAPRAVPRAVPRVPGLSCPRRMRDLTSAPRHLSLCGDQVLRGKSRARKGVCSWGGGQQEGVAVAPRAASVTCSPASSSARGRGAGQGTLPAHEALAGGGSGFWGAVPTPGVKHCSRFVQLRPLHQQ